MTKTTLSRRHLLAGASATAAASFVASARPAAAKAPLLKSQAPAFYRFNVEVGDRNDARVTQPGPDPGLFTETVDQLRL